MVQGKKYVHTCRQTHTHTSKIYLKKKNQKRS
jgi:hypothetical protein